MIAYNLSLCLSLHLQPVESGQQGQEGGMGEEKVGMIVPANYLFIYRGPKALETDQRKTQKALRKD